MADDQQIIISYGGVDRPAAESALSREIRPNYSQAQEVISYTESWTLAGDLLPDEGVEATSAHLKAKLNSLITQFERPGLRLQRKTTGGLVIDDLNPAECLRGPFLEDVSFPSGADSVLPVRHPFTLRLVAERRPQSLGTGDVLEYSETVEEIPEPHAEWQGGRFFPGRLVRTKNAPGFTYRQQGRVLTLADRFVIPRPLFANALIASPQIRETSKRATKAGSTWEHVGLEISWSYEMTLPYKSRFARPHQWPGSTLRRF